MAAVHSDPNLQMSMWHRSWLFVPADEERKVTKGRGSGADALILDLEDSVVSERRSIGRALVGSVLDERSDSDPDLWVRINSIDGVDALEDLVAAVRPGLGGVVLPKLRSGSDLAALGHYLDALEARSGMAKGSVSVMTVATETPQAIFRLGELGDVSSRLAAVTWGAEDLAAALGALSNLDADGNWESPFEFARSLALYAAATAGAQAIDTIHSAYRDEEGLRRSVERAVRHGFTGKLAIHPSQVPVINSEFSVASDVLKNAEAVIAAFSAEPSAGVVALDGRMYDRPHLIQALRIVARSGRSMSDTQRSP